MTENLVEGGESLLRQIRRFELYRVRSFFEPGAEVLEIGGGSGFQAHEIASWRCRVTSIDIQSGAGIGLFFPVGVYDGRTLPFPDASFDIVFSSNVLEHVRDLPALMGEMKRVLRPGGSMVHIVPSATWRVWTNVAHYLWLVQYVLGRRTAAEAAAPEVTMTARAKGWRYLIGRALLAGPHGENPNSITEIWRFSRFHWRETLQRLANARFERFSTGLFYTGYTVLRRLPLSARCRLARRLGSSCHVFVSRRAGE